MAELIALEHPSGLRLDLWPLGITWASCQVRMPSNEWREVILGATAADEPSAQAAYMGTVVGRYANRIANAQMERDGVRYPLVAQPGSAHQLHGGPLGLHRRTWKVLELKHDEATFHTISAHGDQGFPGELDVTVRVQLLDEREIAITYAASTTQPTPVCLTHHPYFNLDATHQSCLAHRLQIRAEAIVAVDEALIPTGELRDCKGTPFDFSTPQTLALHHAHPLLAATGGHDHAYLLDGAHCGAAAASLGSSSGDLRLDVHTSLPAMQLYSGRYLAGVGARDGQTYAAHAGVALEPQWLPDSPNHPEWPQPDVWLMPSARYLHTTRYRFTSGGCAGLV